MRVCSVCRLLLAAGCLEAVAAEDGDVAAEACAWLDAKLMLVYGTVRPGNLANVRYEKTDWTDRQEYAIVSSATDVVLRASGPLGFSYAAADLLHELGYRRFAPHPSWEIVPTDPPRRVTVDRRTHPDYRGRVLFAWLSPDQRRRGQHDEWKFANRLCGETVDVGHSYERFVRREKAFFAEHPECLALVKGERKGDKLCISNPLLRERFVRYELERIAGREGLCSVSAEPSDGGGWCECADCKKLGSPSDRAVFLANAVARAAREGNPLALVGLYAYNLHGPPPSIPVEPNVIVCVATDFLRDGWSAQDLVREWGRRARIGIREYYWAHGLPGQGAGTDTAYLARTIPLFHRMNAHWMVAETSDAWIPALMGFNVAAALMWDVKADPEAIKADLVAKAFPSCPQPARTFFDLIDGGAKRPVTEDLFARLYEALDAAWRQAGAEGERGRLRQLVAYALWAERMDAYLGKPTEQNAAAFLEVAGALAPYHALPTYSWYRKGASLGKVGAKAAHQFDWKTPRELPEAGTTIREGLLRNRKLAFTPVGYGEEVAVCTNLPGATGVGRLKALRGGHVFHLMSDGRPFELKVTGGLIKHYRDRGNVRISLVQIGGESDTGEMETTVFEDSSVPPDGVGRTIRLVPRHPGLHRLQVSDGNDSTKYEFPSGLPVAVHVTHEKFPVLNGDFFFYVPKGTKTLGAYASGGGMLVGPAGEKVVALGGKDGKRGFFAVDVPKGADGAVWKVTGLSGVFRPLTAPAWLSIGASAMMIPKDAL